MNSNNIRNSNNSNCVQIAAAAVVVAATAADNKPQFLTTTTTTSAVETPANLQQSFESISPRMQPTLPQTAGTADMDLTAVQSTDWFFKKEQIYLLAQFWQQVSRNWKFFLN